MYFSRLTIYFSRLTLYNSRLTIYFHDSSCILTTHEVFKHIKLQAITSQTYHFNEKTIRVLIPDNFLIQQQYLQEKERAEKEPYYIINPPYWAKIWPASIALCKFIAANTHYIQEKNVAEIAAGLGLPSLLAAHYAKEVHCSDYNIDAVETIRQSIAINHLNNVFASLLDWQHIPHHFNPDTLLLSDVNYEPEAFAILYKLIINLLNKGTTIILSTPQRLVAKSFVEQLLPYCILQEDYNIEDGITNWGTTVFVLKSK